MWAELAATWPTNDLLPSIRRALADADEVLLHGELSNRHLLTTDGLNVKRSSAVCALLARLPNVEVASTHPIILRLCR